MRPIPNRIPRSSWLTVTIGLATLLYTWVYYRPMLAGPLVLNDDMVQHYLWLFVDYYGLGWSDDFYAEASAAIQPRGFYYLLKAAGRFVDPLTISRAGPFLIALLTVGYGTALLRRYTHVILAVAGCWLVVHLNFHSSVGFVARSFMTPLLLAFAYYLLTDRPWGTAVTTVAAALLYPPALLINGGVFLCWKLGELVNWVRQPRDRRGGRRASPFRDWWVYGLGFGVALLVVWWHAERVRHHPYLGGYLPLEELLGAPEFQGDGRVGIRGAVTAPAGAMVRYFLRGNLGSPLPWYFERLVLLAVAGVTLWRWRTLGRVGAWLLALGVVCVAWYYLARATFPLLFLPDRYLVYPWRTWAPLLLTFVAMGAWTLRPRAGWAAVLGALLLGYGYYRQAPAELPVSDQTGREEIFAAVAALPEDAVVAMPPALASQVPVFTRRQPFVSTESAHALYFRRYNAYVMPRFRAFTDAYTTRGDSLQNVVDFMRTWEVDYLMVDRNQLRNTWFRAFEPHNQRFYDRLKPVPVAERTLLHLPDSVGVLIQDRLQLVSAAELEALAGRRAAGGR